MSVEMAKTSDILAEGEVQYTKVTINGIQCIQILVKGKKSDREKLGDKFRNTPILDFKTGRGGRKEYCDALVYSSSDNMVQWMDAYCKYYLDNGYTVEGIDVSGGEQKQFDRNGARHINISFYNKSRLMFTQPGAKGDESIQIWLDDFAKVRQTILSAEANLSVGLPSTVQKEPSSAEVAIVTENDVSAPASIITEDSAKVRNCALNPDAPPFLHSEDRSSLQTKERKSVNSVNKVTTSNRYTMTESMSTTETLIQTENTPMITPEGYINLIVKQPPMPLGYTYHKRQMIVNEVLCYLQNKITLPFKILVKITSDFYSDFDITEAKRILFHSITVNGHRYRKCQGTDKKRLNVEDMVKLLLAAELDDTPIFLAMDTAKIPPLTNDTLDSCAVLHKIEQMQQTIDLLAASQKQLSDNFLSHVALNSKPPSKEKGDSNDIVISDSSDSQEESLPLDSHDSREDEDSDNEGSVCVVLDGDEEESIIVPVPDPTLTLRPPIHKPVHSRIVTNSNSAHHMNTQRTINRPYLNQTVQNSYSRKPTSSGDKIVRGTGPSDTIRAAKQSRPPVQPVPNGTITGLFVSNLHPATTSQKLETHIRRETGKQLQVTKLRPRSDGYSSFHVPCDQQTRTMLMNPVYWPTEVLVKPYRWYSK